MNSEGIIFNIKRFSVHDGPGIRTSIFLKGCPLRCIWCHNPEGINPDFTLWYNRNICISCGECVGVCTMKALDLDMNRTNFIEIDRIRCNLCGDCTQACPAGAIEFAGRRVTTQEIMQEIRKDLVFYNSSCGGVTLSGGEPLFQPGFCIEILKKCHAEKIHTAIETCLFCEIPVIEDIVSLVDLFMVDLKIIDSRLHEEYTGKGNETILTNLEYLYRLNRNIIVRVPLIKGITDPVSNRKRIEQFVNEINPGIPIEYLDFNYLTKSKYLRMGISFPPEL